MMTKTGGPNLLVNVFAFVLFTSLWLAFAAALLVSPQMLGDVWAWLRGLPLLVQLLAWLLLLPVVVGLWIWHQEWALLIRLLLIAGLAIPDSAAGITLWGSRARKLSFRAVWAARRRW